MKTSVVKFWISTFALVLVLQCIAQPTKVYTSLAEASANPEQVYKLVLRKNKYEEIPEEIFQFKNLTFLDLSKNRLSELPTWFLELKNLEELYFTRNKFTYVPLPVFELLNLRILVMDRNPIKIVSPNIRNLTKLEFLNFWDSEIEELPETISALKNLKRLDLRNTLIYKKELPKYQALLPTAEIQVTDGCDCKKYK